MEQLAQIEKAIERKRKEMHHASDRYGLSSSTTLKKSKELDALLNKYQQKSKWLRKR